MIAFPCAKINIGLQITEKRSDGFHNLQSCFYPVSWTDILEIIKSPHNNTSFSSSGIGIPGNFEHNLCLKAYNLLKNDFDLAPVQIHLHKNIPIGAGLGGGSADGSFSLKLLNQIFELNLSDEILENYARQLGSDCAFFIENTPKYCFEKGDKFTDISVSLTGKYIVLINPAIHISTTEAYSGIIPQPAIYNIYDTLHKPIAEWKYTIQNDFEKCLFNKYPLLNTLKTELYKQGALFASMTGSGSTIYGIFENAPTLTKLFSEFSVFQTVLL